MSIQARRERERAERERLIVRTARELAETEGWDAVTTRRIAGKIEYSQPVLYSHFSGKNAIMTAVAVEAFAELAAALHEARTAAGTPRQALAEVAAAYLAYAERCPALYEAMFIRAVDLPFATPEAPAALRDGFAELQEALRPLVTTAELGALTETFWAGLHGLVTLQAGGRLPAGGQEARLALLVDRIVG